MCVIFSLLSPGLILPSLRGSVECSTQRAAITRAARPRCVDTPGFWKNAMLVSKAVDEDGLLAAAPSMGKEGLLEMSPSIGKEGLLRRLRRRAKRGSKLSRCASSSDAGSLGQSASSVLISTRFLRARLR